MPNRAADIALRALRASWAPVRSRWPALAVALLLAAKQVALVGALGMPTIPRLFLTALAASAALAALAALRGGRAQLLVAIAIDLCASALLWGDALHFRQFGDVPTAASLGFVPNLRDELPSIVELMRGEDALLFVDVLVLALLALRPWPAVPSAPPRRAIPIAACFALAAALLFAADSKARLIQKGHSWPFRRAGPFAFHAWDVGETALRAAAPRRTSAGELQGIRAALEGRRGAAHGPLYATARGRNLIVVQVESLQGFALGLNAHGVAITPSLDALARESLRFERFYHQVGPGVTSDADALFNCSLYPLARGAIYTDFADSDFRCLPGVLRDAGYRTAAFQAIRPDFWNLAAAYPRVGFERFDGLPQFAADEQFGHGLTDLAFVRQAGPRLSTLPEPFFAFLVTLTSHHPFLKGDPLPPGRLEGTLAERYLAAVRYTDRALGELVGELRRSGLLDRSVLVVYGDHHGIRASDGIDRLPVLAPRDAAHAFLLERRVPLLVRFPGGQHAGAWTGIGGQVDLAPTLASLLGVDARAAPFFGRDLLAAPPPFVAFPDGSALDASRLWLAPTVARPRAECRGDGGEALAEAACARLAEEAARELAGSRALVEDRLLGEVSSPLRVDGGSR